MAHRHQQGWLKKEERSRRGDRDQWHERNSENRFSMPWNARNFRGIIQPAEKRSVNSRRGKRSG